jgi:AraC-like DNA-binding protein
MRPAVFRFSTDDMPPHQRAAAVREMHERCGLSVQPEPMEPLSDQPVRVDITQWQLPGLGMMSGVLGGLHQQIRPQRFAPTGSNDAFLAFSLAGSSVVIHTRDDVVVRGGDAFLAVRGAKGFSVGRPKCVRFIGLRFPSIVLYRLVRDFDAANVHILPSGASAPNLLRRYVSLIAQDGALATSELQRAAVAHVYDLAAVALGATADRAELALNRGVRAARLETIKADVLGHLDDGKLNVASVAARQGVTPRYLQKLFESEGTSFSQFVLDQRLAKAHRILMNPLYAHRPIGNVAYDVGFNDLSHFNRAFRRRYGSTPSDVRHGR